MSIAPPTGAMSAYLARLVTSHTYRSLRDVAKQLAKRLPRFLYDKAKRTEEYGRGFWTGGTLFEELGFYYVGPIDGHKLDHLLPILKNVRDMHGGPVLVHVVTKKGKGYPPAEAADDKYHGVAPFDVITGAQAKPKSNAPDLHQSVRRRAARGGAARRQGRRRHRRHASGDRPRQDAGRLPRAGVRRRHRRTARRDLCGRARVRGLQAFLRESIRPSCSAATTRWCTTSRSRTCRSASPSIAPVLSAPTARPTPGAFDLAYLACLPNMTVMAAADEAELVHMVATAVAHDNGPIALRYPRGDGVGVELPERGEPLPIGKGRILREGARIAILTLGTRLAEALKAAEELAARGLSTTVADARFAKPLDRELILRLAARHEVLITVEEGAAGGFGAHVLTLLAAEGALDHGLKVRTMTLPDAYQEQDKPERMYAAAGLDANGIVATALAAFGKPSDKPSSLIA